MNSSSNSWGGNPLIRTMVKSLCMDPGTHSIINSVDKHGINPPTVPNLNEAFIEILGLVSDFAATVSGDVGSVGEASTRAGLNAKSQRREPAVAQKSTPHQSPQVTNHSTQPWHRWPGPSVCHATEWFSVVTEPSPNLPKPACGQVMAVPPSEPTHSLPSWCLGPLQTVKQRH